MIIGSFLTISRNSTSNYGAAKRIMSEDLYPSYRILERLMVANNIRETIAIATRDILNPDLCKALTGSDKCIYADLPSISQKDNFEVWANQTVIRSTGQIQASADSSNNLIRMKTSMIDTLDGNPEILSCVIAHELAHLTQNHWKQKLIKSREIDRVKSKKVRKIIGRAKISNNIDGFFYELTKANNSNNYNYQRAAYENAKLENKYNRQTQYVESAYRNLISTYRPSLGYLLPQSFRELSALQSLRAPQYNEALKKIEKEHDDFRMEYTRYSRIYEKEADSIAIEYVAKAGINPEKCLGIVDIIHRQTTSETGKFATHPGESERRQNMINTLDSLDYNLRNKYKKEKETFTRLPYFYQRKTDMVRITPNTKLLKGSNQRSKSIDEFLDN